jgi:amidase
MMSDEPSLWSASRQAKAIRTGEMSSRDLLESIVARIERINPSLNAVVTKDFDKARAAADAADETLARGDEVGPLHGLLVTIKDALQTEGIRSTGGAAELMQNIPARDAPAVRAV